MKESYCILPRIKSPGDLRTMSREELEKLSDEVRDFILEKLSPIGGHLASSLGVVELTIALHAVFKTPEDRIIWDVGHQSYVHKILTGRKENFRTIRQYGGLSGFPKRSESPYDSFGTGHSSTSISAALGMAAARDLTGRRNKVIAVIGDGSMNSGMAFEGLNNAGHEERDLIVVLNDNEMSISRNVGALSGYLSRVLSNEFYFKVRKDVRGVLKSIPGGESMARIAKKMEEHAKGLISPGMLFEELGFTYFGPIDGHNMSHLLRAFGNIAKYQKPLLVHVVTRKGKGFHPAESMPVTYHGVGPFNIKNGESKAVAGCAPSYTAVFGEALVEMAKKDDRIVAITAAMTEGTGLSSFEAQLPERFFDVGIAEEHAVTFAAGLAAEGLKPVVAIYSTFMQRAYDQIVHDVALQELPVVFALDRAGLVGADGPTHHGAFDVSYLRHIPGMTVMAPSDENELVNALATAFSLDSPSALRYPRGHAAGVKMDEAPSVWPIGKGRLLNDGGEGAVALLCLGTCLSTARQAAERAEKEGVKVSLFDARFAKPLDEEAILGLSRFARGIVTVEENVLQGGFGSAVLELLSDNSIRLPVKRLGIPDRFVTHGSQVELKKEIGLDEEGIYNALMEAGR
jgi:1-deoxy-D-xylulose-5-phosphate synthase